MLEKKPSSTVTKIIWTETCFQNKLGILEETSTFWPFWSPNFSPETPPKFITPFFSSKKLWLIRSKFQHALAIYRALWTGRCQRHVKKWGSFDEPKGLPDFLEFKKDIRGRFKQQTHKLENIGNNAPFFLRQRKDGCCLRGFVKLMEINLTATAVSRFKQMDIRIYLHLTTYLTPKFWCATTQTNNYSAQFLWRSLLINDRS